MKPLSIQAVTAALVVLLGIVVILGWLLGTPLVVLDVAMVFSAALAFVLVGVALLVAGSALQQRARISAALGWVVMAIAGLGLASTVFDTDFGLDLKRLHEILVDSNPRPGRMAPNTAVAFLFAGLALVLMQRVRSKAHAIAVLLFSFLVLLFGATGLVGFALYLELLFVWFKAARMALPTAVGLVLVGIGLWASWHRAEWYRSSVHFKDDEKIAWLGTGLMTVIGFSIGVTGFAAQQAALERTISQSLPALLDERARVFENEVLRVVEKSYRTAEREHLLAAVLALDAGTGGEEAEAALLAIGRNLIDSGATAIVIRGSDQREWLRLGRPSPQPRLAAPLDFPEPTLLFWDGVPHVRSTVPLHDGDRSVGSLVVEEPVPMVALRVLTPEGEPGTGNTAMCLPGPTALACYPDNHHPEIYSFLPINESGQPSPMGLAVKGRSGLFKGLDYRGRRVFAAYRPLSSSGLGLVSKTDTNELFAPIREQLLWGAPALLLLVAVGALVLRAQIKPLATRLVRAEARMRSVVEGVGDGIITIDDQGTIESMNRRAADMFGYAATEAVGLNIKAMMPSHLRAPHDAGMARYRAGGPPRIVGQRDVELPGLCKDGTTFPLELTVNVIDVEGRRSFVGIVRDITQRKLADAQIFEEKERLRVTLKSIGDGVITTDTAGAITYMNPVAEEMTGWTSADAVGQPLLAVFNIVNEETGDVAVDPVAMVLRHQAAAGLAEHTTLVRRDGARFAIEDSAAPIRSIEGEIIGVVLVFHDVTKARSIATEMTHQATHDALTGLMNRRAFERRLEIALESKPSDARNHTVLFLDLDNFKPVNDTCGHAAGDALLRQVAIAMRDRLRKSDALARLGGDEFGVLLEGCPTEPALRIADGLRQAVAGHQFEWEGRTFSIGVSIGLATFVDGTVESVLRMADAACYAAKHKGRNQIQVHAGEVAGG